METYNVIQISTGDYVGKFNTRGMFTMDRNVRDIINYTVNIK